MIVELIFCVGLGKFIWDRNKSSMVVGLLSALLVPKADPGRHSKATRTASNTLILNYTYGNEEHELVLPVRKRRIAWTQCLADMGGDVNQDVTNHVAKRCGPYGDFFGLKLTPGQICRGARKLTFINEKNTILLEIE